VAMLWASDVVTPILVGATGNVQGSLLAIGGSAVAVGTVVLGLRAGWKLFRRVVLDGPERPYVGEDYSGNDGSDYEQSATEQDSAASSYLDRYRNKP
jgi:hypothetical protein